MWYCFPDSANYNAISRIIILFFLQIIITISFYRAFKVEELRKEVSSRLSLIEKKIESEYGMNIHVFSIFKGWTKSRKFNLQFFHFAVISNIIHLSCDSKTWFIKRDVIHVINPATTMLKYSSHMLFSLAGEGLRAVEIEKCKKDISDIKDQIYEAQKRFVDYSRMR